MFWVFFSLAVFDFDMDVLFVWLLGRLLIECEKTKKKVMSFIVVEENLFGVRECEWKWPIKAIKNTWRLIACTFNPGDAFKSNAAHFSVRSNASDQNSWAEAADQTCSSVSRFLSDSQLNTQNQKKRHRNCVCLNFGQFYKLFHKLRQKKKKMFFNSFSFFGCFHWIFGLKNHFHRA